MLNKTPLRLVATDERPRPGEDEEATPMTLMSEEAAITRKVPESEMIAARDMLPEKRKRPDWHKLLPAGAVAVVVVVVILALATKGKSMAPPALDTHRGAPVAKPDEALRPHASGSPPTQEGASPSEAEGRPEIIRVEITATPVETELSIDGNVVASHRLNLHVPNDRGIHVLSASAPGYVTWKGAMIVRGEGAIVTVIVPPLGDAKSVAAAGGGANLGWKRIAALGLGGLGALAIGGGLAAAISAKSRYDDASTHCDATGCDEVGASIQSGAVAQGNLGTVFIGLGLVSIAGGVYLWITGAPERKTASAAPSTSARIELRPLGTGLGGRF